MVIMRKSDGKEFAYETSAPSAHAEKSVGSAAKTYANGLRFVKDEKGAAANAAALSEMRSASYEAATEAAPEGVNVVEASAAERPKMRSADDPTFWQRMFSAGKGAAKSYGAGGVNAAGTAADMLAVGTEKNFDVRTAEQKSVYQRSLDELKEDLASAKTEEARAQIEKKIQRTQATLAQLDTGENSFATDMSAAAESLHEKADELSEKAAVDIAKAKAGAGELGQFAVDLGVAGAQLAGDAAVGALTGGGALIPMAIRAFGGGAQEARQSGATLGQQVAYGTGSAALSMGIEKLTNFAKPLGKMFGKGFADDVVAKLSGRLAENAAGRVALSALGEGAEEAVEAVLNPVLQRITYDKDASITADTLAEAAYNALIGASLGGLLGVGGEVNMPRAGLGAASAEPSGRAEANDENAPTETPVEERGAETIVEGERGDAAKPAESQIYHWGTKKDATLDGAGRGKDSRSSGGVSSEASTDNPTLTHGAENVKNGPSAESSVGAAEQGFDPFTAAQNEFGTLPSGENPVRPDDVPVSTNGTDRVSQSVVTVKGAKVTPDEFVPLIENETMKGEFSYIPITNDATVQAMEAVIMRDGWSEALRNWTADVRNGKSGEKVTAMGALLYNNAVNAGNSQLALDILADYMVAVRSAARGLQAARILKKLTPESRLYMMRRSVQRMVDDLQLDREIRVPAELDEAYLNAADDAARDAAVTEIQQYVADQIPASFMDKWTALRYVNMLGNFKTQIRNAAGNVGMVAVSELKNLVATELELLVNASGGNVERSHAVRVGKALMDAGRADYAELGNVLGYGKYNDGGMSEDSFAQGVEEKRTIFKSKLMEGYRRGTNWAMNNRFFGDEAFGRHAYARSLAGYLKANGITAEQFTDPAWREANRKTVDKAREHAVKEAREATFRDNNILSDWVSRIGRRADTPKAVRALSEGVMPFRRTPANILVRAAEYSPLGVVKTSIDAVRKAKGADISGADIIDDIAKTLTGSAIFGLGMLLRNAGMLRGGEDEDEKQAAFDDLTGHQAYSLELPDGTSVTMDWLTPASMPLFMGVELMDLINEGGFELKDLEQALTSIAEPMLQMSMLQGISDTLGDLQYSQSNNLMQTAGAAALGYLTQGMTNSLLGQMERIAESDGTMSYVDKESPLPAWLQREIGAASRKVPGWDYEQVPYIDAWGRTEERGDVLERSVNSLFNPAYMSRVEMDELESELQRLYDTTGEGAVLPNRADKSFNVNGATRNLTAEEYVTYATAKGQTSHRYATEAVNSAVYKNMSDSQRADLIDKLYKYANYKAKCEAVKDYANTDFAKVEAAEKAGISPVEFYAVKSGDSNGNDYLDKGEAAAGIQRAGMSKAQGDVLMGILFPKK